MASFHQHPGFDAGAKPQPQPLPRPLPPLPDPLPPSPLPLTAATRRVLITGGGGFLGFRLAATLAREGMEVTILDLAPPRHPLPPRVRFAAGSVADAAAVEAALDLAAAATAEPAATPSVDAVFHVASYGMSGRELRDDRDLIEEINVGGTANVVAACVRQRVPRLVYVSTCNTIFVGRPILGGDEAAPYPPASAYKDAYSATKAIAERLVLASNGTPLRPLQLQGQGRQQALRKQPEGEQEEMQQGVKTQPEKVQRGQEQEEDAELGQPGQDAGERPITTADALHTCAIRSTGIWGPGETRHQPRVIRMVRAGLFAATFGDPSSLSDWIHVDNLVQLLVLAERGLRTLWSPQEHPQKEQQQQPCSGGGGKDAIVAAGQVYYASDGAPINNFHHFKPFILGLGYCYPTLNVPYFLVYGIAAAIEVCWPLLRTVIQEPPLTRMEVDKCCITHWFCIDKARSELCYQPASYDREEVVTYMVAEGWAARIKAKASAAGSGVVVGLLLAGSAAAVVVLAVVAANRARGSM